ncbi:MAG TPA: hypothetical protein VFA20_09620 [Myxococcaceae bacterium]|nr:hypothetical protein [Myxococcaceae bacterium]
MDQPRGLGTGHSGRRALAALTFALGLQGCLPAAGVRDASREAVHGAAEGIATLPPERVEAMRKAILGDPDVAALAREVARGAVEGGASALTDEKLARLTEALVEAQLSAFKKSLAPALADLEPRFQDELRRTVITATTAALGVLRREGDRDLERWTAVLVRTSAETLLATLRQSNLIRLDDAAAAANRLAAEVGRGAVAGAASELRGAVPPEQLRAYFREGGAGLVEGLHEGLGSLPTRLESTLIGVTVVLAAILIGLAIAAVVVRRELQLSRKALAVVATQVNAAGEGGAELKRSIYQSAEKNHIQPWLSTFLKDRGL